MKGGVDPVARGWELADAARHAEAVVVLDGAEEVIRGSRAWRLARAHSLRLLGRVDEAEAELQAALEAARQLPEAYTELAWIRQAQRRLDEGLELARRAIQLASGHPTEIGALHAAGALAFELGLLDEAQRHADRLVKLRPKRTEFRMGRGWISLARNDPAEALAEARQVLARNPGDPGALDLESRARANLESLESTPSRATERH
jgi:tetratricopeptide (TPR) repeat protein